MQGSQIINVSLGRRLQRVFIPLKAVSILDLTYARAFNFGEFKDGKAQQPIPETIEHLQDQIATFWEFCYKLCLKINYLLGVGLDVSA